jgi:hypothetical protein
MAVSHSSYTQDSGKERGCRERERWEGGREREKGRQRERGGRDTPSLHTGSGKGVSAHSMPCRDYQIPLCVQVSSFESSMKTKKVNTIEPSNLTL